MVDGTQQSRPLLGYDGVEWLPPHTSIQSTPPGRGRDLLDLFLCHLEWRFNRNVTAYQELIAALDDPDDVIRTVAEKLLHRSSPRPQHGSTHFAKR